MPAPGCLNNVFYPSYLVGWAPALDPSSESYGPCLRNDLLSCVEWDVEPINSITRLAPVPKIKSQRLRSILTFLCNTYDSPAIPDLVLPETGESLRMEIACYGHLDYTQ